MGCPGRQRHDIVGSHLSLLLWLLESWGSTCPRKQKVRRHMLDPAEKPEWIKIKIKESKTDRLRKGALITLCRTREPVCPVVAFLQFMGLRKAGSGPFFRLKEGKGLDRKVFVQECGATTRK